MLHSIAFISGRGFFSFSFSFTDYFSFVVFCNLYVSKACFPAEQVRSHIAATIKVSLSKLMSKRAPSQVVPQ